MKHFLTREVKVGDVGIGGSNPIRIQTMTTTDTMDTMATVEQSIRCIEAGAELVRITAPSINEANNLLNIKNELHRRGFKTPLVADIHFTPNAAEVAARIVEKVRVNPGNYADKKKFETIDYTDAAYSDELQRIREKFSPLVKICKEYGTAMRIGTNHGSLSDRIMSRYGDSPMGMVMSAFEFLEIAEDLNYHNIVLSMKSSNPTVMIEAYRLLVKMMMETNRNYPLHLGVTEAGDGEDGRIKSAIGIGTLLQQGIGDTIRVSLTEDPEFELPVCKDLVKKYGATNSNTTVDFNSSFADAATEFHKRQTIDVGNIGSKHVPVVVADFMKSNTINADDLQSIGYTYLSETDKWKIADAAADYIYTGSNTISFALPGTLKIICDYSSWKNCGDTDKYFPLITVDELKNMNEADRKVATNQLHFVSINTNKNVLSEIKNHSTTQTVLCIWSDAVEPMNSLKQFIDQLTENKIENPVVLVIESHDKTVDEQLIHFATESGALLLDGIGNGIWLMNDPTKTENTKAKGRTYLPVKNNHQFINNTSFSILQATRTRISKTEYISCPSCGRTLFDLQETTARIRNVTHHLKGVKIAIMGCIVNGPGEMADADYGYVGSGPGKITLYKGKEVVKKSLPSAVAVDELINLIKENGDWVD